MTVVANPAMINPGGTATLTATVNANSSCAKGVGWSDLPVGGTVTTNGNTATFHELMCGRWISV